MKSCSRHVGNTGIHKKQINNIYDCTRTLKHKMKKTVHIPQDMNRRQTLIIKSSLNITCCYCIKVSVQNINVVWPLEIHKIYKYRNIYVYCIMYMCV